jgi:hypothetical protein
MINHSDAYNTTIQSSVVQYELHSGPPGHTFAFALTAAPWFACLITTILCSTVRAHHRVGFWSDWQRFFARHALHMNACAETDSVTAWTCMDVLCCLATFSDA